MSHFSTASRFGTLLTVWAHPDDEAYLAAGLILEAQAAGSRVVVATATKGEAGMDESAGWTAEQLASLREAELAASLGALGVTEHHGLGHRDGTLPDVDPRRGIAQVGRLIRRVRPDTIVTFGPDGLTGHTDHQTVSTWVTAAWMAAGRPGRLWYVTLTPEFHHAWGAVSAENGVFYPGTRPPSVPRSRLAYAVRSTGEQLDRKFAALAAHASQTTGLIERVGIDRYRQWWAEEAFVDAEHVAGLGWPDDERQVA